MLYLKMTNMYIFFLLSTVPFSTTAPVFCVFYLF